MQKREQLNIEEIPYRREGAGWTKMVQENAGYASMVAAMDENVGRVLSALKNNGLDKNTWVIFTSDNGGRSTLMRQNAETSNYPLRAGKGWCYEGGIRVPLIIAGPEVENPGRIDENGIHHSEWAFTDIDVAPSKSVIIENWQDEKMKIYFDCAHAKSPEFELFDINKDPYNLTNLAGNSEFAAIEKELKDALMAELRKTEDPRVVGPDKEIFDSYERYSPIRDFPKPE